MLKNPEESTDAETTHLPDSGKGMKRRTLRYLLVPKLCLGIHCELKLRFVCAL
ncbi:MAG: hypothetical protein E3K37_11300 [Candidatus Kuenenia sp.]|nr:hypothetical protein [Candidatus Kuenenia hertensis]